MPLDCLSKVAISTSRTLPIREKPEQLLVENPGNIRPIMEVQPDAQDVLQEHREAENAPDLIALALRRAVGVSGTILKIFCACQDRLQRQRLGFLRLLVSACKNFQDL